MAGKFPFPKFLLKTPVKIYHTELGEEGEIEELLFDGKCFYEEKTRQVLDAERKLVTLSGKVILEGDIYPDKIIQGYVQFGEIKKDIFKTARPRNPDGTVFSTELELV
ncbi:hypothetical protein [Petroclostridium sp. X23]|uniref:hypothetical protein n=1 Tax=Petroclostridium sp. X23 TaxID=3045146 RepID=UPI0024AE3343|nr:hypothetical protein [Petroclostridium sp. X23]WHH58482.1 hypothetical protein QKW49_22215 [Petroclostridium sp. X23]